MVTLFLSVMYQTPFYGWGNYARIIFSIMHEIFNLALCWHFVNKYSGKAKKYSYFSKDQWKQIDNIWYSLIEQSVIY